MCRPSATNSTISGTIATVAAAITSGHMKLFHCDTTVINANVTRIGRLAGITTWTMTSSVLAPSTRAALTRSAGMVRKYSRSRKIAYGEPNMNGSTNAQNVLRRPTSAIIRYNGTTVTVAGTISVAM